MGNKLTKEEIVEKAKKVHGDKYDYSEFLKDEFVYENYTQKIPIICHEKCFNGEDHGVFKLDVNHHIYRKQGCPVCSNKRYDLSKLIHLAQQKYKNKYTYENTKYLSDTSNEIIVSCKNHGEFITTPGKLLNGEGCPKCLKPRLIQEEEITKFKKVHGNKYIYDKTVIKGARNKIIVTCPIHGDFATTPNYHKNGHGCPKCAKEHLGDTSRMSWDEFVEKANRVHGNKYNYKTQNYKNNKSNVIAVCPIHGDFSLRIDKHLQGVGCAKCNESKLEQSIRKLLSENKIEFISQCGSKIFKWLNYQKYDFYLPKYNVAIECQGEQHFFENAFFDGKQSLKERQMLDKLKLEISKKHGIKILYFSNLGIKYPYEVFEDKEKLLNEILNNCKMIDSKKLIEELKERGLMSSVSGDLYDVFSKPTTFYVGTDPTGDSLHVGHLLAFTTAKLLQSYGHRPIVLIGDFTSKIGDPSFRDTSRPLITDEQVRHNSQCIKAQVSKLIDFESNAENKAIMLNNDEWMGKMNLSDYMKNVAKLTTVNYMMAKESVKKRLSREGEGISLCEFLYMTAQGYDFLHLYKEYGCRCQIGGQDQYGNCTIGLEFIRKALGKNDACALTWPLVTRADGTKFGKSANGKNIWLDANKTSPFEFYQFWLNQSDDDAESFIKKFTLIPLDEIGEMIAKHRENPSKRYLQKELAKYMTCLVHSEDAYKKAVEATEILFGNGTYEQLSSIDEETLLSAMSGVPKVEVDKGLFDNGVSVIDLAAMHDKVPSKSEARKLIKGNGFSINKIKPLSEKETVTKEYLIGGKYLLLTKGKKEHSLVIAR